MRSVLAAAILITAWAANANGQTPNNNRPVCTADQSGGILVTTIEYTDGYRVEAPWRVTSEAKFTQGETRITALLDHIIETDPLTRKKQVTALPGVVEMMFKGDSRQQLLREAAEVWCTTVGKAMADRSNHLLSRVAENRQVM